jgi:uncharacterized protein YceK
MKKILGLLLGLILLNGCARVFSLLGPTLPQQQVEILLNQQFLQQ